MAKRAEPLFNNILLKQKDDEKQNQYGNIVIPDMEQNKASIYEVIEVGPGFTTYTGEFIPTQLKKGDIVVLPGLGAQKIKINGEDFVIIKENDILTKLIEE